MKQEKPKLYILGGGLAGISLAINKKQDFDITIIESSEQLGGLLNGIQINGNQYPIGAHFLRKSGNTELDEVLFSEHYKWKYFDVLSAASTSFGRIDTDTGFLNINSSSTSFKLSFYMHLIKNLLKNIFLKRSEKHPDNLLEMIKVRFGTMVAEQFNNLSNKYYGLDLEEQEIDSIDPLVCTDRVKCLTPRQTILLKKIPYFDRKIAYHRSTSTGLLKQNFVPYQLQYKEWWHAIAENLKELGINLVMNTQVVEATPEKLVLNSLNTSSEMRCHEIKLREGDTFIDTIGLIKRTAANHTHTTLLFFESDQRPSIRNHFVTSYTSRDVFSRITLCGNIGGSHNGFVVEIVLRKERMPSIEELGSTCIDQMKEYGIISGSAKTKLVKYINLRAKGFRPKLITNKELDSGKNKSYGIQNNKNWFMGEIANAK